MFIPEVEIDGAIGDTRGTGNLRDSGIEVSEASKDLGSRLEYRVKFLRPRVNFC